MIGRRREAGHVTDHPAAHRDDHVVAREPELNEATTQALNGRQGLLVFPLTDENKVLGEACLDAIEPASLDQGCLGHDRRHLGVGCHASDLDRQRGAHPGPNQDVIGARLDVYLDPLHERSPSAVTTAAVVSAGSCPSTQIVRLATAS